MRNGGTDVEESEAESVVVVGSGFGGLSSACFLAQAGYEVTVLEKNEQLGGRASVHEADGFRFDMGPSWYLMPDVFEWFFAEFDRTPADYYELTRLDPHYRIFWKDGDQLDVVADIEANKAAFESYETGAGDTLDAYLDESKFQYEVGMEHFVFTDRPRWRDYIDMDVLRHARGLSLLGTMQKYVSTHFTHPKLQQLMQYSLVFLGGAPDKTPALYNLMSHVDFNLGVYYPMGGIVEVVNAMESLGEELGVHFVTDTPVTGIEGSRGEFTIQTATSQTYNADIVVSNADYAYTESSLLGESNRQYDSAYWESRTFAPSAYLLYLGVEGEVSDLAHHTLILPPDWDGHFDDIFESPAWPDNPAYYLCVPSKTDPSVAPDGKSALFILVPIAPGLSDSAENRSAMRSYLLADIAAHTGVDLTDRISYEKAFCVDDFASRYNSYAGSALGLAHTLRQTAVFRPNRTSSACDGLYYTGSYTTPGIGVPMCLISGYHTAEAIGPATE